MVSFDNIDTALFQKASQLARTKNGGLRLSFLSAKNIWRAAVTFGSVDLSTGEDSDVNEALKLAIAGVLSNPAPPIRHTPLKASEKSGPPLGRRVTRKGQ